MTEPVETQILFAKGIDGVASMLGWIGHDDVGFSAREGCTLTDCLTYHEVIDKLKPGLYIWHGTIRIARYGGVCEPVEYDPIWTTKEIQKMTVQDYLDYCENKIWKTKLSK